MDEGLGWRVQLGAFSTENAARQGWSSLQSKSSKLKSEAAYYDQNTSGIVRLQTGSFGSRGAADSHCNGLKSQGVSCFVVKAGAN
jgi:uncharacterized protein